MNKGDRRRERERLAIAEYEQDGFVPRGPWRDPEARVAAMEHAAKARIAHRDRMARIR